MRTKDYADVAVMLPVLFLGALALGYALARYFPIGPGLASPNGLALTVGLIFMASGFTLVVFPARRLRRWILLLLIPVLVILYRGVVLREEAYLEWKFGDEYRR